MNVGIQLIFQNVHPGMSDEEMFLSETRTAELAEELGFDSIWPVEHHFRDYAMCPDNTQFLAYMAGRTKRIKLGTGAVILPWNDPLRVAEKISVLDHLANGRVLFGMGRGLSRREYGPFQKDMNEARGRFDEAAPMILEALETGVIEGKGPFYPQPRTEIRPRPSRSFKGRTYAVAVSVESVPSVARIGAAMMFFTQYDATMHKPGVDEYRRIYRETHGKTPPPIVTVGFTYCDEDAGRAAELGRKYILRYFEELMHHYELAGDHFANVNGYKGYAQAAEAMKAMGLEKAASAFVEAQDWGTPQQILEKIAHRREVLGDIDVSSCFSYGGMPFADVEKSMRTFAKKVLPEVHSWQRPSERRAEPERVAASA